MSHIQYQLTICIIGAENIPDISTLGKMDLFAQIIYGKQNYKTCVLHDCGSCPLWNYNTYFNGEYSQFTVEIWDQRFFGDKYISEATIDCKTLKSGNHRLLVPLKSKDAKTTSQGHLLINLGLQRIDLLEKSAKAAFGNQHLGNLYTQTVVHPQRNQQPCRIPILQTSNLLQDNMHLVHSSGGRVIHRVPGNLPNYSHFGNRHTYPAPCPYPYRSNCNIPGFMQINQPSSHHFS